MAGTPVAGAKRTFYLEDVAYKRAVSEGLLLKFAEMAMYFSESISISETIEFGGYFEAGSLFTGAPIYFEKTSDIDMYYLSLSNIGTSGLSSFNFNVYDELDALQGTLFTGANPVSITGSGSTSDVVVGQQSIITGASDIDKNIGGVTHNNGVLNITTIEAGWHIVPDCLSSGTNAINAVIKLRFKEQ